MKKHIYTSIIMLLLLISIFTISISIADNSWYCRSGWFIDIALIISVYDHDKAYFDVPINYSDNTYNQTIYIVETGGKAYTVINNSEVHIALNLSNMSIAYFIARFKVCGLREIVKAPSTNANITWDFPEEVIKYVKKPHSIISIVRKDFENWLCNEMNITVDNLNPLESSYYASIFIYYSNYIIYNASPYPRDIEEVIESKVGDCDDMSRVLINLLWSYGIPAKIEDAYVWIDWMNFNLTIRIENSIIIFEKAGPHAYVLAYIPTYGWVALDLLGQYAFNPFAGSRHLIPVLILGHDENASVSKEVVEEFKEFHKKVTYIELVGIYSDQEIRNIIGREDIKKFIDIKLNELKELAKRYLNITILNETTTTMTPTTPTTTISITSTPLTTTTPTITTTLTQSTTTSTTATTTQTSTTTREIETSNSSTITSPTTSAPLIDTTILAVLLLVIIGIGIVLILLRK